MSTFAYPLTGLVTVLALLIYIFFGAQVGKARGKFSIPAPAMSGPDDFMRVLRVQGNTLELLVIFLPALWLFAATVNDLWAAAIGVFFPIGRIIYARGYYTEANKRGTGFLISFASCLILLLGAAWMCGRVLIAG